MNREIKFRVWDLQRKYFSSEYDIYCSNGNVSCSGSGIVDPNRHRFIPQQYTGLKDKNGKEIYEGDILSYKGVHRVGNGVSVVSFDDGSFMIDEDIASKDWAAEHEVIGNIFENPELLES